MIEADPGGGRTPAKTLWRLLAVLLVALAVTGLWATWAYQTHERALYAPMPLEDATLFAVQPGASFSRVARNMAAQGWVSSARFLAWYARAEGKAKAVKAGTYELHPGMSAVDALDLFVSGKEVQYPFTIVEGWTFRELRDALARSTHLGQTLGGRDDGQVMAALGQDGRHPEGMFLADTYLFPPGTKDIDLLARAHDALQRALASGWADRAPELPLDESYHALILASIIEKETADPLERPRIAGVFVARLRRGMLLQTDPTVIYGLGDSFDGNIRRKDLRTDTPYNTYTRKGLPPTPIALVGRESITAALNPQVDGSLFFVSRGDGSHQFSRTYAEHQRAVRRYQLGGRQASGG